LNRWVARLYLSLHRTPAATAGAAILGAMLVTAVAFRFGGTANGFVWG